MKISKSQNIVPHKVPHLPPDIKSYESLIESLTLAHAAVGELRGYLNALQNPDLLIAPFRKREAVASSAIEGTRATLEEVLEYEALDGERAVQGVNNLDSKHLDILEVMNYEKAMGVALSEMKTRPIGENLLKVTHSVLLDSVRGADKDRGNFRREQVMVGDYIPPVHTEITALISNWEKYINSTIEKDPLIRIGVAHYQFEAIHPFRDGNGRIGRLVIPLFMCEVDLLQTPVLYVSHFFEEHKLEYQKRLHNVDLNEDWIGWLQFFLKAVENQARVTTSMAREIQNLYEEMKRDVIPHVRSQHALAVLDLLFCKPVCSVGSVKTVVQAKSNATTYNVLAKFVKSGMLTEYKVGREKIYFFNRLLSIVRL